MILRLCLRTATVMAVADVGINAHVQIRTMFKHAIDLKQATYSQSQYPTNTPIQNPSTKEDPLPDTQIQPTQTTEQDLFQPPMFTAVPNLTFTWGETDSATTIHTAYVNKTY